MRDGRGYDPIACSLRIYFVLVAVFLLAPIVFVVVNSFNSAPYSIFPPESWSLRWYRRALFEVPQFWRGLKNSVICALGAMGLAMLMSTLASRALSSYRFRAKEPVRSFLFSPMVVPRIVFGCALFLLYIRIKLYGTIAGIMLGHSLLGLPFGVSVITATWLGIDPATEEAARDLGANTIQAFLHVVLPQLRVALIVSGLFAFMQSFDQVDVSLFITRPDTTTLPIEMLNYAEEYQDPALAAVATLLILFAVLLVVMIIPVLKTQETRRLLERKE